MTTPSTPRSRFVARIATVILALAGVSVSRATLLVYEGFNGYTTGTLAGQTPNANTAGLDTTVGYYDGGGTRTAGYTIQATGLSLGSLQTSGGALAFTSGTNVIGPDIEIGATAFTGTLWSSYLVNLASPKGGNTGDGAVVRIGTSPADSANGHFNSWADSRTSGTASTNVGIGYGSTTPTATNGTAPLAVSTTYIIISSFTNVGASLSSGTSGVAKLWALNASQFASFLAAGGDEAALAGTSVTATATQTVTTGTFTFSSSNAIGLVTVGDIGVIDELRFGSSLADVTPIPEPATTALLLGIGCGVLITRRRIRLRS